MKKFDDEYMASDLKWMRDMRQRGFCVVVFTPEELDGVDPDLLDDMLTSFGLEQIEYLQEEDDEEF